MEELINDSITLDDLRLAEFGPDASDLVFKLALIKFQTEVLESGKEDMNEDQTNAEIDLALTELTTFSRVEPSITPQMETEQTAAHITGGQEEPPSPLRLPAWILYVCSVPSLPFTKSNLCYQRDKEERAHTTEATKY